MERYELKDRLAVVTGASSGMGWSTAKELARRGARVALLARRRERLEALAAELNQGRETAHVYPADLVVPGEAARVAAAITEADGPIDILVNNAGSAVGGPVWAVADSEPARAFLEVDLWSPLALVGAVVPTMRRRGHGAIVNVTSIQNVLAWPSCGLSSAACAAISQVTETLRLELLRFGVRVVEVIAGPIDTPAQGPTSLIPGLLDAVLPRFGMATPEELAAKVADAIELGEPRVFCPDDAIRAAYEDPVALRRDIEADVRRLLPDGSGLPDEMLDTLVVASDNPMITEARERWEREHAAR